MSKKNKYIIGAVVLFLCLCPFFCGKNKTVDQAKTEQYVQKKVSDNQKTALVKLRRFLSKLKAGMGYSEYIDLLGNMYADVDELLRVDSDAPKEISGCILLSVNTLNKAGEDWKCFLDEKSQPAEMWDITKMSLAEIGMQCKWKIADAYADLSEAKMAGNIERCTLIEKYIDGNIKAFNRLVDEANTKK